jgi:hypothetical protein
MDVTVGVEDPACSAFAKFEQVRIQIQWGAALAANLADISGDVDRVRLNRALDVQCIPTKTARSRNVVERAK